jgi:DNA-binding CsgD family transcriptional regulator/tetratricopeptide (TPR) repeat protein
VLVGILGALNYGERPSVARARALEALAVARAAGAVAEEAVVHHRLGSILAYGGDAEAGLEHLREARRLCAALGRVDDMALALNDLGDALMMLGRIEEALATFDEALVDLGRAGLARSFLLLELNAADCELRLGHWPRAAARLARVGGGRIPDSRDRLFLLTETIWLAVRRGALDDAVAHEREAIALLDGNVGPQWIVITTSARAELALARGDPATARNLVTRALERIGKGDQLTWPAALTLGLRADADLAEEARARGDGAAIAEARTRAEALLDEVGFYRCFEEPVDEPGPPEALTHYALGEAELARLEGEPRPDLWADVAARWQAIRHPYQVAYARMREAEAWLATGGERSRAGAALRAANGVAAGLGAELVRRDTEALARRARLSLGAGPEPAAPAEPPLGLTPRELTVLELLSAGRTNRQIAEDLFLSRRTVDMHVRHVLAKLHAANRVEAAGIAHRLGLGRPA